MQHVRGLWAICCSVNFTWLYSLGLHLDDCFIGVKTDSRNFLIRHVLKDAAALVAVHSLSAVATKVDDGMAEMWFGLRRSDRSWRTKRKSGRDTCRGLDWRWWERSSASWRDWRGGSIHGMWWSPLRISSATRRLLPCSRITLLRDKWVSLIRMVDRDIRVKIKCY